jgi:hypothetical protein
MMPACRAAETNRLRRGGPACYQLCLRVFTLTSTEGTELRALPRGTVAILRTKTNTEMSVGRRAEREHGVGWYAPLYRVWNRHDRQVEAKLLPGFVFIFTTGEVSYRALQATRGALDFVLSAGSPALEGCQAGVRRWLSSVRAREDGDGYVILDRVFRQGQSVRARLEVDGSPAVGAIGICEGYTEHMRVRVLFSLFGRDVRLTCGEGDLVAA